MQLPTRHRIQEPGVQRLESLKGGGHDRPGTGGVELGRKLGTVLRPTRVGQRPPARAGEPGPLHPAERLEVLEGLHHLTTIQGEPVRDPALVGEPEQPHGMQHQQRGLRRDRFDHRDIITRPDRGPVADRPERRTTIRR